MPLVSFALLALALASDPAAGPLTLPARPGDRGLFLLADGRRFAGRLVVQPDGATAIAFASDVVLGVPPGSVVGRLPDPDRPSTGAPRVLLTVNGEELEGGLLARGGGVLRLRLDGGEEREVREADLSRAEFQVPGTRLRSWTDPARIRYVHLPQPGALQAGEWTLRSSLGSPLDLETAPLDGLALGLSLETPLLYGNPVPPMGVRATALGQLAVRGVRLSAGVTAARSQGATTVALQASASVGGPRLHATLHAGPPLAAAARLGGFDAVVVGAAGAAWLSPRFALVGETWWTPRTAHPEGAVAGAVRAVLGPVAVDAGALGSTDGEVVPWFAFALDGNWRTW